jgi:small ligand-binding sensory domain FIST
VAETGFASALSEHPIAAQATGEVAGSVLESIGDRPDLVVVNATRPHAGALEDIAATLAAVLHPLAIVGCAAESVLGRGAEVEETPALSLWAGRVGPLLQLSLGATRLSDDEWHFEGWPDHIALEPRALVLIGDPFTFPTEEFLSWFGERMPGVPVVGGNASAGRGPGASRLVVGDRVVTRGATAVLLGPGVAVETVLSQGCRPYGRLLTVTRSDRNIIYEIAGKPAMERMVDEIKDGLEPIDVAGIEANGLFVGRLVDDRISEPGPGDFLVRNVVGVDRSSGAVAVNDRVPLGATIRFHLRDAESAHRDLQVLLHGRQASAALMFSCNGRGSRMFDTANHDVRTFEREVGPAPLGGFFAAGEIGPVGGSNFLHSFSSSIALFREQ